MIPRTGFQRRCATACALLFLIAPVPSLASEPSSAETHGGGDGGETSHYAGALIFEQFIGEKLYIQSKGELYAILETGYKKSSHESEFELAGELSFGVTERLQLVAELPFVLVDPDNKAQPQQEGLGDVTLGFQYNFMQEYDLSLGVRSGFVIPSGDENKDLGGGQFVWEPNLMGAFRVGQGEIYAAVGGEIRAGSPDPHAFTYTISGAYPWWHLVGVLELGGTVSSNKNELFLAPGLFWDAADCLQIGLGAPIGLTSDAADYQIVGLFVFEFF